MGSSDEPTPLAVKTAATIKRILDAARIVFGSKGLDAATMDRIADEAGLSKQIIYYYFGNKEALYHEVIRELILESHAPIFEIDYDRLSPIAAIRKYFEISFEINVGNAASFALDQMLLGGKFIKPGDVAERSGRRVTKLLEELIERGKLDGSIRPDADPLLTHLHSWMLNVGFLSSRTMLSKYMGEDVATPEFETRWRSYAVDALIAGLAAKPAKSL